jgi:hypothetical protein
MSAVLQVYPYEYDLVLQPDINTRGHTQWYYFSVRNIRAGQAYIFNIINLQKPDSLYNMGMLPLLHSEQQVRCKVRSITSAACCCPVATALFGVVWKASGALCFPAGCSCIVQTQCG